MVDGNSQLNIPGHPGDHGGDGKVSGCVVVSVKDRMKELHCETNLRNASRNMLHMMTSELLIKLCV